MNIITLQTRFRHTAWRQMSPGNPVYRSLLWLTIILAAMTVSCSYWADYKAAAMIEEANTLLEDSLDSFQLSSDIIEKTGIIRQFTRKITELKEKKLELQRANPSIRVQNETFFVKHKEHFNRFYKNYTQLMTVGARLVEKNPQNPALEAIAAEANRAISLFIADPEQQIEVMKKLDERRMKSLEKMQKQAGQPKP